MRLLVTTRYDMKAMRVIGIKSWNIVSHPSPLFPAPYSKSRQKSQKTNQELAPRHNQHPWLQYNM